MSTCVTGCAKVGSNALMPSIKTCESQQLPKIPARDPKQCKNKMKWSDTHSSPLGNLTSHVTTSPPLLLVLLVCLESYVGPRAICQEPSCFWPVSDSFLTRFWPVSDPFLTRSWPVSDLFLTRFWPVSDLFLPFLTCFWPVSDPFLTCFALLLTRFFCDHSMCEQHVWAPRVSTLGLSTLCASTMCEHSMCEHSLCEHSL